MVGEGVYLCCNIESPGRLKSLDARKSTLQSCRSLSPRDLNSRSVLQGCGTHVTSNSVALIELNLGTAEARFEVSSMTRLPPSLSFEQYCTLARWMKSLQHPVHCTRKQSQAVGFPQPS
jgi:hypothetical protein